MIGGILGLRGQTSPASPCWHEALVGSRASGMTSTMQNPARSRSEEMSQDPGMVDSGPEICEGVTIFALTEGGEMHV
jgi:hypothetical protein